MIFIWKFYSIIRQERYFPNFHIFFSTLLLICSCSIEKKSSVINWSSRRIFLQLMSYLTRLAANLINHSILLSTISRVAYNCSLSRPGTYSIYCSTKFTLYQTFTLRLLKYWNIEIIRLWTSKNKQWASVSFLTG